MSEGTHAADIVIAAGELVERSGASEFQIGHDGNLWYAVAVFRGARLIRDGMPSPSTAALALTERVLFKALCRCGEMVTLDDERDGCRWRLQDARWTPGCDVEPVKIEGERGDMALIEQAMTERHGSDRVERAKRARP